MERRTLHTQIFIADLYASMAFKSHLPSTELKDCREAENWYQRGLPNFLERKAQGKQGADEDRALAEGVQNMEKCGRIVTRLDHATESSSR